MFQHITYISSNLDFSDYDENDQKILYDLCEYIVFNINKYLDMLKKEYTTIDKNDISRKSLKYVRYVDVDKSCLVMYFDTVAKKGTPIKLSSFTPNYYVGSITKIYKKDEDRTDSCIVTDIKQLFIYSALEGLKKIGTIFDIEYKNSNLMIYV